MLAAVAMARQAPAGDLRGALERLESADPSVREAGFRELKAAGSAGARVALLGTEPGAERAATGFRASPAAVRELRARVLREVAVAEWVDPALELASDPAVGVRRELARYLGQALRAHPPPPREAAARALATLQQLGLDDPEQVVRSAAFDALSLADDDAAGARLAHIAATGSFADAALAARALSNSPRSGRRVIELVTAHFSGEARLSLAALTPLMAEGYGPALAEFETGGLSQRERLPFAAAARDASPQLRAAAEIALATFLGRARFIGAVPRAAAMLEALELELPRPARATDAAAVLILSSAGDPAAALAALDRAIERQRFVDDGARELRFERATTLTLRAAAHVAAGDARGGEADLERAQAWLAGLASEGHERTGDSGARFAAAVAQQRAVVACHAILARLVAGEAFDGPRCRALARDVHELSLRAQLLDCSGELTSWTGDLDSMAHHPHGPFELLLSNAEPRPKLGDARTLALALGRALALAAPDELPGLASGAPPEEWDEARQALVARIEVARLEQVDRELSRPGIDLQTRTELESARRVLAAQFSSEADPHRVRLPSALAIEIAGELRDEGRSQDARALALEAKRALSTADFMFGGPYVQELIARAESIVGSCATDDGDPREAERILEAALQRLETLSSSGIDDARSRAVRSNVLVSLAVNANVKLREQDRALAYFERAFELRQDDFTRTLLACYRARAGRVDEARALLAEMPPSPFNYYNLACTHALLGDTELAFEYLEKELSAGSKAPGAIERQRAWARADPDLDALRSDPRFASLVGP